MMAKITQENLPDILMVQGVNAAGYGTVPKSVMIDQRLTPYAKLIYAYFCSYAGAGDTAFPSINKICSDLGIKDVDTFRKHRKLLDSCGYIRVRQVLDEEGKFGRNVYTLISNPITIDISQYSPLPKKPGTDETRAGNNPSRVKSATNNNSTYKNNSVTKNNTHTQAKP